MPGPIFQLKHETAAPGNPDSRLNHNAPQAELVEAAGVDEDIPSMLPSATFTASMPPDNGNGTLITLVY